LAAKPKLVNNLMENEDPFVNNNRSNSQKSGYGKQFFIKVGTAALGVPDKLEWSEKVGVLAYGCKGPSVAVLARALGFGEVTGGHEAVKIET
jgi:hypothetical protein